MAAEGPGLTAPPRAPAADRVITRCIIRPVPGARCPVPGARCPVPGARCPVPGARCPVPGATIRP